MNTVEINSIKNLVLGSKIIGYGKTSICFKMKDNNVFKYYINTPIKSNFFRIEQGITNHLKDLSDLNNDTYKGPETLVFKNNELIGYIYPYINAKTLAHLSNSTMILEPLNNYSKLLEDTKDISSKNFILEDTHSRNILYDGKFYVIDLDFGRFDENYLLSNYHINIKSIVKAYLKKILGVTEDELFIFYDDLLEDIYRKTDWTKIDEVHNFFDEIIRRTKKKEPTILDVKKAKLVHKELNDYHFHL